MFVFSASPSTYDTIMSPTNLKMNAPESSRPRKVSTQKIKKPYKQRKIPKVLDKVASNIFPLVFNLLTKSHSLYIFTEPSSTILLTATQRSKSSSPNLPIEAAKTNCYYHSIQPPVVSESLAPPSSSLDATTPQLEDTVNLASYFPPANFVHSPIPVSAGVYCEAEPSHVLIPSFQYDLDFSSQSEDSNILSLPVTNNPCQSCGRYDPPSGSTGSMEYGVEPYQQLVDPNTQYFVPQPILPYASNASATSTVTFPGNSYDVDIFAEIMDSSHLTMMSENNGTTLLFPNYDTNSPPSHTSYYM